MERATNMEPVQKCMGSFFFDEHPAVHVKEAREGARVDRTDILASRPRENSISLNESESH